MGSKQTINKLLKGMVSIISEKWLMMDGSLDTNQRSRKTVTLQCNSVLRFVREASAEMAHFYDWVAQDTFAKCNIKDSLKTLRTS